MRPLRFRPILKQTLWGGNRILPYKGMPSSTIPIGECWELSGLPGSESVVAEGEFAGQTLPELIDRFGASLVGRENYARFGREFPLLVKLIDAREALSIQVHPDDALARRRGCRHGKSEMWYILEAQPDTSLLTGFSRAVTPGEFRRRAADGTLAELLTRRTIAPGDVFYLPAGQVHSIGRGALLVEIQQASDLSYRIYDFDRVDASGHPRALHLEQACEAIDFRPSDGGGIPYERLADREIPLLSTPQFSASLCEATRPLRCDWSEEDSFAALVVAAGEGTLRDNEGHELPLAPGQTLLIPASTQWIECTPRNGALRFLTARV